MPFYSWALDSDANSSFSKEGSGWGLTWSTEHCAWVGRVTEEAAWWWRRLLGWPHSRKARCVCGGGGGERGAGDRAIVEDSTACEDRMYWQIPPAQGLLGGPGWPEVECSLGTGLLGDTILKPVSGTDLWKNPNLLIWLLTCSSPQ